MKEPFRFRSASADLETARKVRAKPLIISNYDPAADEILFANDRGSWNVSRALRDCEAGKHQCYLEDVGQAYRHNKAVEVDKAKVKRFMRMPDVLAKPLVGVIDEGAMWLIDGHHRLRAMHRLGKKTFQIYIIEDWDAERYRVLYNGERKPPFDLY